VNGAGGDGGPAFPLWPVVVIGVAGTAMFNVAPLFLQTQAAHFELSDREIGWLMAAEIVGIALASVVMLLSMRRYLLRQTAFLGAAVIVAGNLVSPWIDSFAVFLGLRFVIGLFGDGLAYVTAIITLGRHPNPIRAFALLSFSNMCLSGVALALLPLLPVALLRPGVISLLVLLALLALVFWRRFPRFDGEVEPATVRTAFRLSPVHLLGLAGLFAFTVNLGAVWGYAERLGAGIGMEVGISARLLSLSVVFQALGSLLAVYLSRYTRPIPVLLLVALLQAVGLLFQATATGPWTYLAGFSLWGASWNLGIANFLGLLAKMEQGRRVLALAPGIEALGAAAGPVIAASLLLYGTNFVVPLIAAFSTTVAVLVFLQIALHVTSAPGPSRRVVRARIDP